MSSSCYATSAANLSTSAPKWHLMEMMPWSVQNGILIDIIEHSMVELQTQLMKPSAEKRL
jgi:hypothetical protein